MNPLLFTTQPVPVRPHQFETPHCYLDRLCAANVIDLRLVAAAIDKRRARTGLGHQLALVIRELGGPRPSHFARSYLIATGSNRVGCASIDQILTRTYRRPAAVRHACTRCTAGQPVDTFDHHRFNICLKHRRWLAPDHPCDQQRQIPDIDTSECVQAERGYRRGLVGGILTRRLIDLTWRVVLTQATHGSEWADRLHRAEGLPGYTEGVDDRLALYPYTARILQLLARPETWLMVDAWFRRPGRIRARLREQLSWIPGHPQQLVELLVTELIRHRCQRPAELAIVLRGHVKQQPSSAPRDSTVDNINDTPAAHTQHPAASGQDQ